MIIHPVLTPVRTVVIPNSFFTITLPLEVTSARLRGLIAKNNNAELPVRDVEFRNANREMLDVDANGIDHARHFTIGSNKSSYEAIFAHRIGTLALISCKCCTYGRGYFTGCVVSEDLRHADGKAACTNCHYGNNRSLCDFVTEGVITQATYKRLTVAQKKLARDDGYMDPSFSVLPAISSRATGTGDRADSGSGGAAGPGPGGVGGSGEVGQRDSAIGAGPGADASEDENEEDEENEDSSSAEDEDADEYGGIGDDYSDLDYDPASNN